MICLHGQPYIAEFPLVFPERNYMLTFTRLSLFLGDLFTFEQRSQFNQYVKVEQNSNAHLHIHFNSLRTEALSCNKEGND